MKIAVVYNRETKKVINLFGLPNQEKIGLKTIDNIVKALKKGGHQAIALEGDKDLIEKLEDFMPMLMKGERPGMVFNVSYGIQGQARYTHVPSILEMVGIPYVGSGPLAHSLALDKVVTKIILRQNGLPTPDFAVLESPGFDLPPLDFPLIVKPKNEAVSFGLRIVNDEQELREGADTIFDRYEQPVLAEQYIGGREFNVGILGNNPPEALMPAEVVFSAEGLPIYTYEDKTGKSGRTINVVCPAEIDSKTVVDAQDIALKAFRALGCFDCARVDMRMDRDGRLYILELNSLPSLGPHGSYIVAAAQMGLDFTALMNRLVEVASARYFGTPTPPKVHVRKGELGPAVFSYITDHRDIMERGLQDWVSISSRTTDTIGVNTAVKRLDTILHSLGMTPAPSHTDGKFAWTWETDAGLNAGTLFITHMDIPLSADAPFQGFRRDPEWLYGEGIAVSRAPLILIEYVLRALRAHRRLHRLPIGVLCYTDEGSDGLYSSDTIKKASKQVRQVFVLRPGSSDNLAVSERRGLRKYRLTVESQPKRPGQTDKRPSAVRWLLPRLDELLSISSRKDRIDISAVDMKTQAFPMYLPHKVQVMLAVSYPDQKKAGALEEQMREILKGRGIASSLELLSERPPMMNRTTNNALVKRLSEIAQEWTIPFAVDSSVWPSVAGLVPPSKPVLCGLGAVGRDLYTFQEAVHRSSMIQRILLLSQFLVTELNTSTGHSKS